MSSAFSVSDVLNVEGTGAIPGAITLTDGTNSATLSAPTGITASYNVALPSAAGTTGQILQLTSPSTTIWTAPPGGSGSPLTNVWTIMRVLPSGTVGGVAVSASWTRRRFTTLLKPTGTGIDVQLAVAPAGANQILVQPGTYMLRARPNVGIANSTHRSRWRNITDGVNVLFGTSTATDSIPVTFSQIDDLFVVAGGAKVFELQYFIQTAGGNSRVLGSPVGSGASEIYNLFTIEKLL